ncbi:MAG: hypothetical protein RLY87_1854 [Chloroflexota bacterium]|jgi:uncharacterized cofD-like protein
MAQQRVVVFGGGGGAGLVLQALPPHTLNTAVIAVTDTGRSTGIARRIGGDMPAPGDIRATIASTARDERMAQLLQHRFGSDGIGELEGMALGNLMLAALYREQGSFAQAVATMAHMANTSATVLPVSEESSQLCARLIDGSDCVGEVAVRTPRKAAISYCRLEPPVRALPAVIQAIHEADVIVIGPGSFYTTIHAVLLPEGVRTALQQTNAHIVFIANTTTQTGQTEHLDSVGHVSHLVSMLGSGVIDTVVLNTRTPSAHQLERLAKEGLNALSATTAELATIEQMGVRVIAQPLIESANVSRALWNKQDTLRHDPQLLREVLNSLLSV